jgi:hypothetical protein
MREQKFLDLARINVLATSDHHVFDPSDDIAVVGFVDDGEIAGVHPSSLIYRLRCEPGLSQ